MNFLDPLGVVPLGWVEGAGEPSVFYAAANADGGQIYLVELYPYQRGATQAAQLDATPLGVDPIGVVTGVQPDAGVVSVLYSDAGYTSPTGGEKESTWFEGRVLQPLRMSRTLPLTPEQPRRVALEIAGIEIINADGALDTLLREYAIDGRRVVVKLGARNYTYSQFTAVYSGRAVSWKGSFARVEVSARDEAYRLAVPLQSLLYGGTGGADGTATLTGKPKPICFGKCRNIDPPMIDPPNLVYQFHSRAAKAVDAVYDRGAALSFDSDAANYAALIAVALTAGEYATCLALGLFRLETTPSGLVTADVRGDNHGASYVDTTFPVAQRVITDFAGISTADIDTITFSVLGTEVTGPIGWWRGLDPISAEDAVSEIVGHCAAWWGATTDGKLTVGRVELPDSDNVALWLERYDVIDCQVIDSPPGALPPRFRQRVGYQRNWTVQRGDGLAEVGVDATRRQFLAEAQSVAAASDGDTLSDFLLAQDPEMLHSLFDVLADAQAEADRLISLFSTPRQTVLVEMGTGGHLGILGQTIALTYPRINGGNTWYARVIGMEVDAKRRRVNLICWG